MANPNSPNPEVETQAPEETPESSSPEQAPTPDSPEAEAEAPETEGEEEAGEEAEVEEGEEAAAAPTPEKHVRKGGFQRKLERLQRQNEQLLEILQQQRPQTQAAEPPKPKTEEERAAEEFESLIAQRVQAQLAQREAVAHQRQLQADLQKQMTEARARHEDFDEAIADVAHIPVPKHVHGAILKAGAKAEIMYALAKNPAELARLSALPPLDAVLEIGMLGAKFASGAAQQTPKPASRPPAPPSKVVGSVKPSTRSLEDLPISEYKRRMRSGGR